MKIATRWGQNPTFQDPSLQHFLRTKG